MREITLKKIDQSIVDEIKEAAHNVPFNQSSFQNIYLSIPHITDERDYRHALLQADGKINNLMAARFLTKRILIDIKEILLNMESASGFELERMQIDLEEKEWNLNNNQKLIDDAMIELNDYYQVFKALPKFTREQFENGEKAYWSKRFAMEAQIEIASSGRIDIGTATSLRQIGIDPISAQEEIKLITQSQKEQTIMKLLLEAKKVDQDA